MGSGCGKTASGYRDRRRHSVRDLDAGELRIYLEFEYRRLYCPSCDAVKRETLGWLARQARFTQRFGDRIGELCREMTVTRVAELNHLGWDQKGHRYRLVVADLDQRRPIWIGGCGRTEEDLQMFFDQMGRERCGTIAHAIMDMWKPSIGPAILRELESQVVLAAV